MHVLIGIPTHRRPTLLRACLESIAVQKIDATDVEVFVADNDPTDCEGIEVVRAIVSHFEFALTAGVVGQPGISAARNAILAQGRSRGNDFVVMIDDDETASAEWLSNLLRIQAETGADIVGGPVRYEFPAPPSQSVINSRMFWRKPRPSGETSSLKGGGNFLVSAQALSKADWPEFDHEFGLSGGEDREWFRRIARLGFRFAWAAEAIAYEAVPPERITARWILQRAYRAGNSDMRISIKHRAFRGLLESFAKLGLVLASAPIVAPLLLLPSWRLLVLRAWSGAAGRVAGLVGHNFQEYASRHDVHVKTH